MKNVFKIGGIFEISCYDKYGNLKWRDLAKNAGTVGGLNHLMETEFRSGTQNATWYIGLISNNSYTGLNEADTMASHGGWLEGSPYTGNRPAWTANAAANKVMTNNNTVDFAITANLIVKGAFLVSNNSGTGNTLFCTALFSGGDQAVSVSDTLKITYTLTASTT
jgi:hypothetical protein